MEWDTVIGLEVHVQLQTKSKLFSGASTTYGAPANAHTAFIDAGLPGVLPVVNEEAINMAVQFGLAINATINQQSIFERKNYFYPDLPKGYQISQYLHPIVSNGYLDIGPVNGQNKTITIVRAHLEEDAGKSLHDIKPKCTGIDLNRAGTPLLEVVTAPCMFSAAEAVAYLKELHQLVRFLGICDGNMQEGSFRCDVNLSLKPKGSEVLGTRTELKNLNSFKYIEKAIGYEQARHQDILESNQKIIQETRLYNPATNATYAMREKENENDYRYFPDPDLLPIRIDAQQIEQQRANMPPTPLEIKMDLIEHDELQEDDIQFILSSPATYQYYKEIRSYPLVNPKLCLKWLRGAYSAYLNEKNMDFTYPPIPAQTMASFVKRVNDKTLHGHAARKLFQLLLTSSDNIDTIIERENLASQGDDDLVEEMIVELINQYPDQVAQFRAGKQKLLGFFVGNIMKNTKGTANPETVSALVLRHLSKE